MLPSSQVAGQEFQNAVQWLAASGEHRDKFHEILVDGAAFVESFAQQVVGNAYVRRDLHESARIVSDMATIALYVWQTRHRASQQEMINHLLRTPFSALLESGISLYRATCGEIQATEYLERKVDADRESGGIRPTDFVKKFLQTFPVAERVSGDHRTLRRFALAFGFSGIEGKRALRDLEYCLNDMAMNDATVIGNIITSLSAWRMMFPKRPAWEVFYPDGMLRLLRELYFSSHDGRMPWDDGLLAESLLTTDLAQWSDPDIRLITDCLNAAHAELHRLWDHPDDLTAILSCPSSEESGKEIEKFRSAFLDPGFLAKFNPDHCGGTKTWDQEAFGRVLWLVFLEKAAGVTPVDEKDSEAVRNLLADACAKASSSSLQWNAADAFVLTEAPWDACLRHECREIIGSLKSAVYSLAKCGCTREAVHDTLFDLEIVG
ncbi:protein of unknown function [Acidithiobacillus ferrivorans]|uniref:Uncharacterized protein n=1 Tax=Acidithiobacillus ferrivorans TaxID=160808 RepID=A0A060UPJ3_9PROT|nr:hypothetical protein [Acidithiobacillus ferrivorans]CDQ10497.1 conserved hypothetical protein [Acidithiobacillus ferrivorans]SMH64527.1 protein of unknown function [Acidithiobacillus ferrivorans]